MFYAIIFPMKQPTRYSEKRPKTQPEAKRPATPVYRFEAEVAEGLEQIARDEIDEWLGEQGKLRPPAPGQRPGSIRFDFTGRDLRGILALEGLHAYGV